MAAKVGAGYGAQQPLEITGARRGAVDDNVEANLVPGWYSVRNVGLRAQGVRLTGQGRRVQLGDPGQARLGLFRQLNESRLRRLEPVADAAVEKGLLGVCRVDQDGLGMGDAVEDGCRVLGSAVLPCSGAKTKLTYDALHGQRHARVGGRGRLVGSRI